MHCTKLVWWKIYLVFRFSFKGFLNNLKISPFSCTFNNAITISLQFLSHLLHSTFLIRFPLLGGVRQFLVEWEESEASPRLALCPRPAQIPLSVTTVTELGHNVILFKSWKSVNYKALGVTATAFYMEGSILSKISIHFFINSESNLTQTQIFTLRLTPNQNSKPNSNP